MRLLVYGIPMDGITGRDGYIIAKALRYACEAIDRLPVDQQETSDWDDMIRLLNAMKSPELALMLNGVKARFR